MAEQLAEINKNFNKLIFESKTSTTTANGSFGTNVPVSKPIVCAYTNDADSVTGAYTVTPEKNINSDTWFFHIRKGISNNAAVANETITVYYWYIDT